MINVSAEYSFNPWNQSSKFNFLKKLDQNFVPTRDVNHRFLLL